MIKKILILALFVLFTSNVFAFDNLKVHLALTRSAAELYNNQTDKKLSNQQIDWLVQGSQAEDTDPRYLNHYYDPTTGKGLDSDDTIYGVTKHFTGISAKEWAKKQDNSLIGLTGDYSVSAILENYKVENYARAYQGVGHIMHLVQDMAVPAHTRNDSHAMGDPFESWAKSFDKPMPGGAVPQEFGSLDLAFDGLANFSHMNFFSKDTIGNIDFSKYFITEGEYQNYKAKYLSADLNGINYKLCMFDDSAIIKSCKILDNDTNLNLDYWNLLAPKAIGYSEGVIDYFIKQFKQIDQEKAQTNLSLWQKTKNLLVGFWGETKYTAGDTILAESTQWQEQGTAGYALSKLGSGLGLAILDQTANQTAQQGKVAVVDTLTQTGNALADAVNQTAILGQKIINTIAKPITAQNLLAPKPASAQIIITKNPAPLVPANGTEQTSITIPGATPKPFPIWLFGGGPIPAVPATPPLEGNGTTTPLDTIAPNLTISNAPAPYISTTSAEFEFTADETPVRFACRLDGGDWQACQASTTFENLAEGNHLLEAIAIDAANNQSTIASSSWLVDLTAPTATIIQLETEYAQTGFTVEWSGEDIASTSPQPSPSQGEGASGLAGFVLGYMIATSSSPVDGVWQPWFTATTATSSIFDQIATSGDAIYIRVRATDRAGNIGAWSEAQTTIAVPTPPPVVKVVINEIYGGGGNTGAVYKNDFIELYNPTDHAISLDSWSVQYAAAASSSSFGSRITVLSGSIASKSYYLIQESAGSGGTTNLPTPDASGTIALSATAGKVALVKSQTAITAKDDPAIMDFVGYGSTASEYEGSGPAPAPSNNIKSIERIGDDSDNNDLDFVLRDAPDPQGSIITPEPPAPIVPTVFCGTQFSNPEIILNNRWVSTQNLVTQTFTTDKSPYLLQNDIARGEPIIDGTLTIEPGVVIKVGGWYFYGWYSWPVVLRVRGKIIARGTEQNPIIFTSAYDQDYCSLPYGDPVHPESWGGLNFQSTGNIFENSYIRTDVNQGDLQPIPSN